MRRGNCLVYAVGHRLRYGGRLRIGMHPTMCKLRFQWSPYRSRPVWFYFAAETPLRNPWALFHWWFKGRPRRAT